MKDKRRYPRAPARQRCWCEGKDITIYAQMGNISEGGMFVRTYAPLELGTKAHVRFEIGPVGEVDASAVVVWRREGQDGADQPPGMGLSFDGVDGEISQRIREFVGLALKDEV